MIFRKTHELYETPGKAKKSILAPWGSAVGNSFSLFYF
jgi:hypothetical protein